MKRIFTGTAMLLSFHLPAQDSTAKKPVEIFTSQKVINANTTETVGKGIMQFKVTHNFGDVGGKAGGLKQFFGLDNSVDVRIGFVIGLGRKLDLTLARSKGASQIQRLWEMGLKYKIMEQLEDDPSHPLSIAIWGNAVVASNKASALSNLDHSFRGFSDRCMSAFQLIIARKMGKISLQLNPTLAIRNYGISYDQKTLFALGAAMRIPLSPRFNLIMDYFHPFRSQQSKDSFWVKNSIKFYDPSGIGVEIITGRHVFNLNFSNATEILENRFIPRTITSWGKGQFRWCFTINRQFTLWKPKKK